MKLRSTIWLAAFILVAVVPVGAAVDPIPCAVGNRWEYDCVKTVTGTLEYQGKTFGSMSDASSGAAVYEVASVDSAGGQVPVYDYRETTTTRSAVNGKRNSVKSEMKVTSDASGLRIVAISGVSTYDPVPKNENYDPPLLYFVKDASPGKAWEVGVMRDREAQNSVSAKAAGRETVTVPAGTFKDCLKVVYVSDDVSGTFDMMGQVFTITSGRSRGIYWIAEGVGVVKEVEVSVTSAQAPGPAGGLVNMEGATCTVSELKPGYIVK